jgi:rRNA maturation RNase YbeY
MPDTIHFFYLSPCPTLRERKKLKSFITSIFRMEGFALANLSYIFCSDEYLLHMNKDYLQHDYYTDIITFNLTGLGKPIDGEIYISIDRVKENAAKLDVSIKEELHRVIFHGALHLCGYNDKKHEDKTKMTRAEDKCLEKYFSKRST